MKHFTDTRAKSVEVLLSDRVLSSRMKRVCLIWDVRGKLRLLFEGSDGEDVEDLKKKISVLFTTAAGPFWSGQTWVWSKVSTSAEKVVYDTAWQEGTPLAFDVCELRILDRHYSKASWFEPPLLPPWPLNEHTPPILSFFSFKGGVGRTTALVSLSLQLCRNGSKVAIIDLDLEAPGISSILPGADGKTPDYGVVDYLLERTLLEPKDMDLADYYYLVDDSVLVGDGPPLTIIPAGRLDENYLEKLALFCEV